MKLLIVYSGWNFDDPTAKGRWLNIFYPDNKTRKLKLLAFATKKTSNDAEQGIEQGQWNSQGSQCVAAGSGNGDDDDDDDDDDFSGILASCNNVGLLFQENEGNLALGQQ